MKPLVLLVILLASLPVSLAEEVYQQWSVAVGVGEEKKPCKKASATLALASSQGDRIAEFPVSLEPERLGIGVYPWTVRLPGPGTYSLRALLRGCDGPRSSTKGLPLAIETANERRVIQLLGGRDDKAWRFTYFGVTTEKDGGGILKVEGTAPIVIRNTSTQSLRPCRKTFWPQVQVLELVQGQWLDGMQFQFSDDLLELASAASATLEEPRVFSMRGKAPDEPAPSAYALKILVEPSETHFEHLIPIDTPDLAEAAPGFCDVFYIDLPTTYGNDAGKSSGDG